MNTAIPTDDANSNLCERNTTTEISVENVNVVDNHHAAPVASLYRRDFEDLLWVRTQKAATPEIDFDSLANLSLDEWVPHGHSRSHQEGFHTYSSRRATPNVPTATEVLVTGELECSLAEAAALFRCPGEFDFNYAMSSMYERAFQRGSVVYSFNTDDTFPDCKFLRRYRCVKTASFARPRLALFDTDDRWCFLEEFAPLTRGSPSSVNGFTISQRSLQSDALPRTVRPPNELVRHSHSLGFKRSDKRIHQVVGLSIGYLVETICERRPAAVRIVLYGCCSGGDVEFNITRRRMMRLSHGVLKLPAIVRRRRMSAQVPADVWSITRQTSTASVSSRCVSCSRALHWLLMVKKSRCYLCAHFVCSRCWIRQPLEATSGRTISVIMCSNCLHSVQNCNYAHLAASSMSDHERGSSMSTLSPRSVAGAEVYYHTTQVSPDADDAPNPGHAVVSYLEDIVSDKAEHSSTTISLRSQTAVSVLKQLVCTLDEGVNRVHHSLNESPEDPEFEPSSALQRLRAQFQREALPLEACVLSNAVTRAYPIDTSGGSAGVPVVPVGPIPPNEANRIQSIVQDQLLLARGSDELVLICELAARELNCKAALVTIVGSTTQYVLASNAPIFQNTELPREHTLCQHLLMGDRPMLVQHPEADIRFCNLNFVADYGIQFYAGFPIFSRDELSVVGSLCCLDVRSREMAQSQYSTLLHLTRTASRIIAEKCSQASTFTVSVLQPQQQRR
ncbi:hypothetical protein F441_08236 [Phytophthora nicotianae CJ01A1]|uniref:FYVE-type domain-containing protein n=2 Tax=Phytophthora nicotianae TaxID=4792 RepID=W2X3G2_PHYNI|nr:hypothetical protein L916_08004 [Phytophthora nicotianae]ETP17355.1 hypothetical protein F441_08236 [Phytophthora nicotianae CJ01A1]